MRFFPFTLKERAKEWFFTLGREFDSWRDMEDAFLRKYYSVGKTRAMRRAIREFSQGPGEVFYEVFFFFFFFSLIYSFLLLTTYLQQMLLIQELMSSAAYYPLFLVLHMNGEGIN